MMAGGAGGVTGGDMPAIIASCHVAECDCNSMKHGASSMQVHFFGCHSSLDAILLWMPFCRWLSLMSSTPFLDMACVHAAPTHPTTSKRDAGRHNKTSKLMQLESARPSAASGSNGKRRHAEERN